MIYKSGKLFTGIFFILLLLSFYNLYPSSIKTEYNNNFLILNIGHLTPKILKEQDTNSYYLKISGLNNVFETDMKGISYDRMKFEVAIPPNVEIPLKIINKKLVSLGKIYPGDNNNLKQLKISAGLTENGIIRGVPISNLIIQPFEYDTISHELFAVESIQLSLTFPEYITVNKPLIPVNEKSFFSSIINDKHLNYFLNLRYKQSYKNRDKILSDNHWYSPGRTYLKITTSKDGIALIKGSDIINSSDYFSGKETKYLHLIYMGNEYPIYFLNDSNGVLSASDSILFTGKRAIGDTTWLNIYTNYAVFYLYYDNSSEGARLEKFPDITNTPDNIEKVNINEHIEFDKIYFRSYVDVQTETETMPGEGWYWNYISSLPEDPSVRDTFAFPALLNPDLNSSDSIKITYFLRSMFYNMNLKDTANPYHHIKAIINNDTVLTDSVPYREADTLSFNYPQNKLLPCLNKLELKSVTTYDLLNRPESPDDIGIDYINITGKVKPYAKDGISDFNITTGSQNANIDVTGMNSPFIAVVDTMKNLIQFPSSDKGSFIRMGTWNSANPFTNIIINDSILTDTSGQGLHIAVLSPPDYNIYFYKFYDTYNNSISTYINSIPDGSIVCIANNSNVLLPLDIRNAITALGSKEINNRVDGQSWIFAVKKGDTSTVSEKKVINGPAACDYFIHHQGGNSFIAHVKLPANSGYNLLVRDASSIENASISLVNQSYLADTNQQADVIILAHKNFLETADSLASYRSRTNKVKIKVVKVEDIYKEFNYGFKSPWAIKNFLKYAYFSWQRPAPFCLIIVGDGSWDSRKVMPTSVIDDYVPSYGWPSSDYWYTLLDGNDLNGDMTVGRIPIDSNSQGMDYLKKIMEYDSIPTRPWMKNFLLLSGGQTDDERANYYFFRFSISDYLVPPLLCGDTICIPKRDKNIGGETESGEIISDINKGAVWTNFLGHGSPRVFDMDGWYVSRLNNKPKYGVLSVLACNAGAFTEPNISCRNEDYMLEADKGFIASFGSTNTGEVNTDEALLLNMYYSLGDTDLNIRQLGDMLLYGKRNLFKGGFGRYTSYQFSLLGDPLTKIRIQTKPDLYTIPSEITIKNENGDSQIIEDDSIVNISGTIYNGGYCQFDTVEFLVIREYETGKDTVKLMIPGICNSYPFSVNFNVGQKPGVHKVTLIIDPDFILSDADWNNNTSIITFDVLSEGLLPVEPLSFWDTKVTGPVFRVIDPKCSNIVTYRFDIRNSLDTLIPPVYSSSENEIHDYKSYIDWKPYVRLDTNRPYWLVAYKTGSDIKGKSKVLWLPFNSKTLRDEGFVKLTMTGYEHLTQNNLDSLIVKGDNNTSRVQINNLSIPFIVDGANGDGLSTPRYAKMILNGKSYVDTVDPSNAPVGMNLVVASGMNGSFKAQRYYETWAMYNDFTTAENFVRFLKDSVDSNDYVLIASCGSAFRAFWQNKHLYHNNIGSYDSLKAILTEYGSKLADSIPEETDTEPNSFVMVGKRGSPVGSIPEALDTNGGLAHISGNIIIPFMKGTLITPVFGPAKKWASFTVIGSLPPDESKYKISIYGISYDKSNIQSLIEEDTSAFINLDNIPAENFPYIKAEVEMSRLTDTANPYISSINCDFIPTPELAMVKESCNPVSDTIMRAESSDLPFTVQNISKRVSSVPCDVNVTIYNSSPTSSATFSLPSLDIDQSKSFDYTYNTQFLEKVNNIIALINPERTLNELYTFNNTKQQQLIVYEDTTKPTIELFLDGKTPHDGDYVAIKPKCC